MVSSYGYYFGQIAVAPDNPDKLYVLGVPLITSDDGGKNWSGLTHPDVHADYQAIWIDPDNAQHLLIGNDGGIDRSYDGGKHWRKLDRQPVGQFYTISVDMQSPYFVYGGMQDNGTWKGSVNTDWKSGKPWTFLFGGDGMQVSIDQRDSRFPARPRRYRRQARPCPLRRAGAARS